MSGRAGRRGLDSFGVVIQMCRWGRAGVCVVRARPDSHRVRSNDEPPDELTLKTVMMVTRERASAVVIHALTVATHAPARAGQADAAGESVPPLVQHDRQPAPRRRCALLR